MTKLTDKKRKPGRPSAANADGPEIIKRAALGEFAKWGFKGTSIDQIATAAGVAKPLIHYHFESKDALWTQAVSDGFDIFQREAAQFASEIAKNRPDDPIEKFAHTLVRFSARHPTLVQIGIDETRQGGERADWLKRTYLVPLQLAMIGVFQHITAGDKNDTRLAAHIIPSVFGATNFPFIDSDVVFDAHGVNVFSEDYIEAQADFIAMLLRACVEEDKRQAGK